MNTEIQKRLSALLTVKSIVTIALTAVFAVLTVGGRIPGGDFQTVFLMVITFYFGTQSRKTETGKENAQ